MYDSINQSVLLSECCNNYAMQVIHYQNNTYNCATCCELADLLGYGSYPIPMTVDEVCEQFVIWHG